MLKCIILKTILPLLLLQLCPVFSTNSSNNKAYRLSPDIIPYNYDLSVVTHLGDLGHFSFNGFVNITMASKGKNTQVIKINSKNLDIDHDLTRINLKSNKRIEVRIIDHQIDTVNEFYIIYLNKPLIANSKYELSISFAGRLTDVLMGYYRSKHTDAVTGETRWLALTQFQPTAARSAFPCFDEPGFKATFKISLIHMDKYTSVSNMPLLLSEEIEPGWVRNTFMLSERMSTYTVAYAVSEFKHADLKLENHGSLFRVWARPDAMEQTYFPLAVGAQLLKYYEEYFQIPYPLSKLDLFAAPDFLLSGMENWGLIIFREKLLLTDTDVPNALPHSQCATLMSHEIAHQWFGNLVTMKWWTEIWLNEGFASHMESQAVDYLFPDWNTLQHDILNKMHSVLTLDAYADTHPVFVPIFHPEEIYQAFDDISYKKGSILIRMINIILGEEAFRSGLTNYLKKLSFLNAEKDDLWQHLTVSAHKLGVLPKNKTVNEIMDPWLLQSGYPLVTVTREYGKGTIRLNQRKFLFTQTNSNIKVSNYCWDIPITYTTRKSQNFKNTKPQKWLTCENNNSTFSTEAKKDDWIILNLQLSGLYRVQYDLNNWNLIKNALLKNHTSIDVMNRAQIIFDVFDFAWIGKLEYKMALNLVTYLSKERSYFPWSVFLDKIQKLYMLMRQLDKLTDFREFMAHLMQPIYSEWSDLRRKIEFNDLQSPKLRSAVWYSACKYQISDCTSKANQLFKVIMERYPLSDEITSDRLIPIIFCNGIQQGGEREWNFLWNLYIESKSTHILEALACTREVTLLQRLLNISHSEGSIIKKQDSPVVFRSVAVNNDVGFSVAKDFFMHNIDKLFLLFKSHEAYLGSYLEMLSLSMVTEEHLQEITIFINKNKKYLKNSSMNVKTTLDIVRQNVEWYKHRYSGFISAVIASNKNKNLQH